MPAEAGARPAFRARAWRHLLLGALVLGSLALVLTRARIEQDPAYHRFADARTLAGVPNFWNVASNLPFLVVGAAGLALLRRRRLRGDPRTWSIFFAGVALVSVGSAYYHWRPGDATLVWDRLPMTIGFMALFVALLGEALGGRFERRLLAPALVAGFGSVAHWHWSGDLRFYVWVQLVPLLTIPALMALFPSRYSHRWLLLPALAAYLAAKVVEAYDRELLSASGAGIGGHAIKHLLAAASCLIVLEMLRRRRERPPGFD